MPVQQRNVDYDEHHVEERHDSSRVASTFIKYTAYVIIFLGVLYFLARYVLPRL